MKLRFLPLDANDSNGPFVSFDTKGRQSQMLRHAHFYIKGGERTFAAVCVEVCYAEYTLATHAQIAALPKFWIKQISTW
jgi:hypothetical protein